MDKINEKPTPNWAFETDQANGWAYHEQIFTPEECKKIIDYAEQFYKNDATVSLQGKVNLGIRESKIVWITPEEEIQWAYKKMASIITGLNENFFRFDLFGFIEGFQFTEYNAPTGHYGKHIDSVHNGTIRKLSFVLQLSDPKDYEGGELQLHLGEVPNIMKKEQGTVVAFPSPTLHEVTPVTKGRRYSLVGWITGKPFK
jgi:PKHD-type hydroxylase